MKKKEVFSIFFVFAVIVTIFFYKTIFQGQVLFPGDLLIAEYNPWKTYSYLGYNPGSFPNKAQYFDVLRQLYPWKTFSIGLLKIGEIPLWNPYNFSGVPLLANFQSAVFYPLNLFYFILPQIKAWGILIILQPMLAGFFTYLLARKIGVSQIGSLFSAVSYGFSSFMAVWIGYNTIGHVILWLPLTLLLVEMLLKKITIFPIIFFVISISAALLAGHPQVFTYSLLFFIAYLIYRILTFVKPYKHRIKLLLFFLFLTVLSIGIGAIQIFPGLELIQESARVSHDYAFLTQKILIQPWQFIMMVVPDFFGNPATRNYWLEDTYIGKLTYIGVIPLFFVLFSFKYLRNRLIRFFSVAGIVVLLLVSFNPITIFLYKFNLPLISSSAPTLSVFLFCFCASLLSGFGIDAWRKEQLSLKKIITVVVPLLLIVLLLWFMTFFAPNLISNKLSENIGIAHRNLFLATLLVGIGTFLIIIGALKKKLIYIVLILLFIIQTGDLFRYFTKFNPFVPGQLVFPNTSVFEFLKIESGIGRFWGYGSANIEANFATQYSLFSPDGYDPLYPKRYGEFIQASFDGEIATEFTRQTRSDAFIAHGFGEEDMSSNTFRLKILDLLGIKYILDRVENGNTEKTFPSDRFKLIYQQDGWKIYENIKALSRVFLVSDYEVFKSKEEFEKIFFDENFDPLKTVLLEHSPRRSPFGHLRGAGLRHTSDGDEATTSTPRAAGIAFGDARPRWSVEGYDPNKVTISTSSNTDTLLFLSDTYYPGWKAFIDNRETKIYRANYAFRAIYVPKGEHEVRFVYDPDSFKLGFGISAISLILTLVLLAFLSIRPKYLTT